MDILTAIKEILYLVQHSTGARLSVEHLEIIVTGLQNGVHPLEIKDTLIMMIHEDVFKRYRPSTSIRSYNW